jgi:hypothetical protein
VVCLEVVDLFAEAGQPEVFADEFHGVEGVGTGEEGVVDR